MRKLKLFVMAACLSVVLCGCVNHNAVVTVNGDAITKAQFEKEFELVSSNPMFAQMGMDLKKDPNSFLHLMLKDRVMNDLIVKKLLEQEFNKRHIKVTKADMEKPLKDIIDKVGSKEKFNSLLKQHGVPVSQFKKELEDEIKMEKLVDSLTIASVSEKAAKDFYNKNLDKFKYPEQVRASHILVSVNEDELKAKISAEQKLEGDALAKAVKEEVAKRTEKANKLLAEVNKNPKDFAKLAKENSDDTVSAQVGGDLGFFSKNEMVEPFSKTAFSMKPNTISNVVKTPFGYHIIYVTDRRAAGVTPYDSVKDEIIMYLESQEKVKALQVFIENLKNNAKIEYKDKSFDPQEIQRVIKEKSKNNPTLMDSQEPVKK